MPIIVTISFVQKNGTVESNSYVVNRGVKSPADVGQVVRFNGKHKLDVWPHDECNRIRGTDTTIYQPFVTPETDLASFSGDICRYDYRIFLAYSNIFVVVRRNR